MAAEPNISLQVCFFKDSQNREVYLKIFEFKANLQSMMYILLCRRDTEVFAHAFT